MLFHPRAVLAAAFAASISTAIGCAAPTPGDAVEGAEGAVSGAPNLPPITLPSAGDGTASKMTAYFSFDAVNNSILERVQFPTKGEGALACISFQDGSDAEKHACDSFPAGYTELSCSYEALPSPSGTYPKDPTRLTICRPSSPLSFGKAPFDREGTYQAFFVNKNDPSDRQTKTILLADELFSLGIDFYDAAAAPKGTPNPATDSFIPVQRGSSTALANSLHIKLDVKSAFAGEVKGCATGFSTVGMSDAEIAAKDAEQIAACEAHDTTTIEGLEGWTSPRAAAGRTDFLYDATPLLQPNQHIIFSFAVNGHTYSYVFTH